MRTGEFQTEIKSTNDDGSLKYHYKVITTWRAEWDTTLDIDDVVDVEGAAWETKILQYDVNGNLLTIDDHTLGYIDRSKTLMKDHPPSIQNVWDAHRDVIGYIVLRI